MSVASAATLALTALTTACTDATPSPVEPRGNRGAPPQSDLGSCTGLGCPGCDEGNDFCTVRGFNGVELALVNSALDLLRAKCGWAVSYLASLEQTGYFGSGFDSGGSFFGFGNADGISWGDEHASPFAPAYGSSGLYVPAPDWGGRIHISAYAFLGNSMQLAMTLAHEAAHGYFAAPDFDTPNVQVGEAEWYAEQCFTP